MSSYLINADLVCKNAFEQMNNAVNQKVDSISNNHNFCVIFRPALKLYYLSKINYLGFKKNLNLYSAKSDWNDIDVKNFCDNFNSKILLLKLKHGFFINYNSLVNNDYSIQIKRPPIKY